MDERKRLRVLLILRAPIGGLFRHVYDLTKGLGERGHDVGIAVDNLTSDVQTQSKLDELKPFLTLGVHSFPMPRVFGVGDLTTPFKIRKLVRKLDIDVLHGHGSKGGVNARFARMGNNKRVALYTPHGGVLNYRPGSLQSKVFHQLERFLLSATDAIIFESAFAQRAFRAQIAVPECPSPVIHNGLSPDEFVPITPDADAHDFVFIGEFRPIKGIPYLLDALAQVKAPDGRPATLIMAGGGPELGNITAQIERLGLKDRVTLAGVQPPRPMLQRGRCEVVPSLAESLPYVILEGAAAARPVIATDVGGVKEIFGPTAPSLIPSANAEALRGAMQRFMDDPEGANREMRERLAFIETRFSVKHMLDQIEDLYYAVIAQR